MGPPAKRQRLAQDASGDTEPLAEASQCRRDHSQESNYFEGQGIQNTGYITIGRDVTIQNFSNQSNKKREDDKRQVLLDSLRFDQMDARQWSIKKAHAHTCRWFLKTPEYANWMQKNALRNEHNFLWIKGKPGAGKSTLMKFLREQLYNQIRQTKNQEVLLSFFFNARGHDLERTTTGLYRSLLLQLLEARPDLQHVLENVRVGHQWTIESLKFLFEEAIQGLGNTSVVCLIDALDECEVAQIRNMVLFFSELSIAKDRLYICFASRHYPHITVKTGLSILLDEQIGHSEDIASYLSSALCIGHDDLAEKIRCDLQEKASGVFMWIVLVVDILNKEYDDGHKHVLRTRIQQLPRDLHDLFHDILTRNGHTTSGLLLCIQWVLFAQQPLTPKQLYFAILSGLEPRHLVYCHSNEVSEDTIKKYILNNSRGLAESTRSNSPTIQFIHESVRDFLLKDGLSRVWPDLSANLSGRSHDTLKQCCLTYMNMKEVTDLEGSSHEEITRSFPFLDHAHQGILYHADQAQSFNISQQDFLTAFPRAQWVKHHNFFSKAAVRRYTPEVSLLYILAETGMAALIRAHPNRQSCFKVEDERYGLPVLAASATKSSAAIETMLELEAERLLETSPANLNSLVPPSLDISYAAGRNFKFQKKGDLLHQLVKYGNEKVSLFFLLTEQCDINLEDKHGKTVLMYAAESGYSVLVEALLQKDADISAAAADGLTPLYQALYKGHTEVAKLLIDYGANLSAANRYGWTPLCQASSNGHTEVTKLLIKYGADLSAANRDGWTPLHQASRRGHTEVAKLLIDCGADLSAANRDGLTPLHQASSNGHTEVAKLLIDRGADLLAANRDGWTPLYLASFWGHIEVAKLLIDRGANLSAANKDGLTPLHQALYKGHTKVAKLLIDRGADLSAANKDRWTPLHEASSRGHTEVAKLLIDRGVNLSAANGDGLTPLHQASCRGHTEVAKLLIDRGADLSAANRDGWTPLHLTLSWGHTDIAKLLIEYGADVSAAASNGWKPLHQASFSGHIEAARLLINCSADVLTIDKDGRTPLHWASFQGHTNIAKLLISWGTNVLVADKDGRTPLHFASSNGHIEVTEILIEHGADVLVVDKRGRTPLHWAFSNGHAKVARLLTRRENATTTDSEEIERNTDEL